MIRSFVRSASATLMGLAVLAVFAVPALQLSAQTQVPAAEDQATPSAPAPAAAPVFPKPDPANFTATSPSKETVASFLHSSWGYDDTRVWQVQAILKTPIENISKVVIFVGDKTGKEQPQALVVFVAPDGKHIISADQVIAFGAQPFAENRVKLQQLATGPYRGSAAKDLEIVEFADFQCPHCKLAQANMDKLVVDYPKARIVFQNDPIGAIHPAAVKAASYGVCVAKLAGSTAFFSFASAVFDGQDGLGTPDGAQLTLNSALAKAGADQTKVTACADAADTKATVDASIKLAADLGISQVPTLVINGRQIPATAPYETLKKIIDFQIKLDGVN